MRTNLTSEQHRFEAIALDTTAIGFELLADVGRYGRIYGVTMAHSKRLQSRWHTRRQQERLRDESNAALGLTTSNGGKP